MISTMTTDEELLPPTLLWIEAETKYMFQKYRLWPSFIGAKVNDEKLTKGVLPVVIWNEQKKFLQDKNALKNNHIIIPGVNDEILSRKRKHDDIIDDDNTTTTTTANTNDDNNNNNHKNDNDANDNNNDIANY